MGLSLWEDVSLTFMNPDRLVDLWPQGQIYKVYDMAFCSGHRFVILSHSHIMWVYHYGTMCCVHPWTLYDLDLWSQYQIIFSLWIWDLQDCLCFLTYGISPWNNMLRTFLPLVCPWVLTKFWLAGRWEGWGLSLVSFTHRFYLGFIPLINHLFRKWHLNHSILTLFDHFQLMIYRASFISLNDCRNDCDKKKFG